VAIVYTIDTNTLDVFDEDGRHIGYAEWDCETDKCYVNFFDAKDCVNDATFNLVQR
jgi:hypothetical protein